MIALDTNILCRHALGDHEDFSPRTNALFLRVASGEEAVFIPETAIFEAIHILHKRNESPRNDVARYLTLIASYTGTTVEHSAAVNAALAFWIEQPALDYADCFHLALTKDLGLDAIYSFDKRMDRYPRVERLEP